MFALLRSSWFTSSRVCWTFSRFIQETFLLLFSECVLMFCNWSVIWEEYGSSLWENICPFSCIGPESLGPSLPRGMGPSVPKTTRPSVPAFMELRVNLKCWWVGVCLTCFRFVIKWSSVPFVGFGTICTHEHVSIYVIPFLTYCGLSISYSCHLSYIIGFSLLSELY